MRLLVGIKCWWQGDWIEYVLRSIYDAAWKIKVVHGPVKVMFLAGFKNDDTLDKARAFPDPDGKIDIQTAAYWPSIVDMANATLDYEADFYLKLDGDEVPSEAWLAEFLDKMYFAYERDLPITSNYWHFIKDFEHILISSHLNQYRLRGFPIKKGLEFRHPDFIKPYFDSLKSPSLKMVNKLHHYNCMKNRESIMVHHAYQMISWHGWSLERVKNESQFFPNMREAYLQTPFTKRKIIKNKLDHPLIVKKHPFWPDGVNWGNGSIDWGMAVNGTIPRE